MDNCVGAVIARHEFCHPFLAFPFVAPAAVVCGEHDLVANLKLLIWGTVFIGMVCLSDFCSKEVVLRFLDIKLTWDDMSCAVSWSAVAGREGRLSVG
jgi:hypothetical protein